MEKDTEKVFILEEDKDATRWFAMRATHRRELKAKDEMEAAGFRVFVPMVMKEVENKRTKRKQRKKVPAVASLVFVYARPSQIQQFKKTREYIQYITTHAHTERKRNIEIPDDQMETFIALNEEGQAKFFDTVDLLPGTPVRIISGPFEGKTGTFQRVNGHRNRYFVVSLNGIINIGSALIRPEMVEEIKEEKKKE